MRPHLEYAIQANCPYLKKDTYHLEIIQRAETRWVKGFRDLSYEDRLKELKLQSLEKRRIRNDLVLTHEIIFHQIDLAAIDRRGVRTAPSFVGPFCRSVGTQSTTQPLYTDPLTVCQLKVAPLTDLIS